MIPRVAQRRSSLPVSALGPVLLAVALLACGERDELLAVIPASGQDSGPDAPLSSRPHFDAPILVDTLNVTSDDDEAPTLTADLLEIYFMSARGGSRHLWTSTRTSRTDPWQAPHQVTELSTTSYEFTPSVSEDGLRIWFCVGSAPTSIWLATRESRSDPWGAPAVLSDLLPPTGTAQVNSPSLDESETTIAVSLRGTNTAGWDLYSDTRPSVDASWGALTTLNGVNGASNEYDPSLSNSSRELFFSSSRSGMDDLFWSQRATATADFEPPQSLDELNDPAFKDFDPFLAADRSVLFFASDRRGHSDIYEAFALSP